MLPSSTTFSSTLKVSLSLFAFRFQLIILSLDARPTESEQDVYAMAEGVLFDAADILQDLQMYKGASAEIRQVSRPLAVKCQSRT